MVGFCYRADGLPVLAGRGKYNPLKESAVTLSHIFSAKKTKVLTFIKLYVIVSEDGSRNADRGKDGGEVCYYNAVSFNRGYACAVDSCLHIDRK